MVWVNEKSSYDPNLFAAWREIALFYKIVGLLPYDLHKTGIKLSFKMALVSLSIPLLVLISTVYMHSLLIAKESAAFSKHDWILFIAFGVSFEILPIRLVYYRKLFVEMIENLSDVASRKNSNLKIGRRYAKFHSLKTASALAILAAMGVSRWLSVTYLENRSPASLTVHCVAAVYGGLIASQFTGYCTLIASVFHILGARVASMRGIADLETAVRDYEKIADAVAKLQKLYNVNSSIIIVISFIEIIFNVYVAMKFDKAVNLAIAAIYLWIAWWLICACELVRANAKMFYAQYQHHLKRQGLEAYVPLNGTLFMFEMHRTKIVFTGLRMFELNEKFFFSLILAVITYIIMMNNVTKAPQN